MMILCTRPRPAMCCSRFFNSNYLVVESTKDRRRLTEYANSVIRSCSSP